MGTGFYKIGALFFDVEVVVSNRRYALNRLCFLRYNDYQ